VETTTPVSRLSWKELPAEVRALLSDRLAGMWDHPDDSSAFDSLSIAAQQALLLIVARLEERGIWQAIRRISNVWGEGGVGFEFTAWPMLHSMLSRRNDFTRWFANHQDTDGGFVEKHRPTSVMHFLYTDATPRRWSLHFDLYSPLHSPAGAWRHLRHEVFSEMKPDWQMIREGLRS